MFTSFTNQMVESLLDVSQNPVALGIFGIIAILILFLVLAIMFPFWRKTLVTVKILEEDEKPSSLLAWVIGIVIIVKVTQIFIVQPFIVSGASMVPNFASSDYLIVDEISYRFHPPQRGDVIIFHPPIDMATYYIKRIIGMPGDTVSVINGDILKKK